MALLPLSSRERRAIAASTAVTALIALAVAWLAGIGRGPVEVDKDVQARHLLLKMEYLDASAAWMEATMEAIKAEGVLDRVTPKSRLGALVALRDALKLAQLLHQSNLRAERKGAAAAAMIDFQAEMLGELTDLQIEGSMADMEPQY